MRGTRANLSAGPLVAWLVMTAGWRQRFVLAAPSAFVLAVVWHWYVRDRPADHKGVSANELALIDAGRPPRAPRARTSGAWKVVLRDRQVLLLTASYFCINYVFYFFLNWRFYYLVEVRGFKMLEEGSLSSTWWLSGAVGAAVGGVWCDRLSQRIGLRRGCRWPVIIGCVGSGIAMAAAALAGTPHLAVGFLCLGLALQQLTDSVYWTATMSVSGRNASAGCGILNTGGNAVGGINALLVPLTARAFGWVAAIVTATALAATGRKDEARPLLEELRARPAPAPTIVSEAWLLGALGDLDGAFEVLLRAEEECQLFLYFHGWPTFDPLRKDPRFGALVDRLGLSG